MNIDFHQFYANSSSTVYPIFSPRVASSLFQVADTKDSEIDTVLCLLDNACYFAKAYILEVFHIASHTSTLFFKTTLSVVDCILPFFLASSDSDTPQVIGIVLMSQLLTCMAIPLTRSSPVGTEYSTQPSKAVRRYFLEILLFHEQT